MTHVQQQAVYYGNSLQKINEQPVTGAYVTLNDTQFYCIRNYDQLPPFFITLVSGSDHWLFISTTGGLSAGRISADHALFPYYTVDKITENSEATGAKTIIRVTTGTGLKIWEPFSRRYTGMYAIERNIYKNISGTTLIFEEVNHDLDLTYRYSWRTSDAYGFVKTSSVLNDGASSCRIEVVDGIQNVLPAHVSPTVQNTFSNLLDAYKFAEVHAPTGLGMFSLSSRLTDLAEPSESLRTNTVWQVGLEDVSHLISSTQLEAFRIGQPITDETYIRGKRGAYFVHSQLDLEPSITAQWHIVAEVEQDSSDVANLIAELATYSTTLFDRVEADILQNHTILDTIIAQADGIQASSDQLSTAHHFANVLFNVMRGGVFADHHQIETADLKRYIGVHHAALLAEQADFFASLPETLTVAELQSKVQTNDDVNLIRLCMGYLPLTFSRRHGDPSRPWNRFQINITHPDGSQRLDYQGNWRDIFQNWEALAYSYPQFIHGMISQFLNATTVDGYNPYRVTRDGIDWEVPEPDNPWANIGYWNDHQIIYLEKLLEVCERFYPQDLAAFLNQRLFSYADVPYQIKPYSDMLTDTYNTIDFDWDKEAAVEQRVGQVGADGKLAVDADGNIIHATLTEKLLTLLLAKLVNFVPEGGIWLNTQRPEWNDANNALVGKGLSIVTLAYLRRYVDFFSTLIQNSDLESFNVSREIVSLFSAIQETFASNRMLLEGSFNDAQRRTFMDALGEAGSAYRWHYYENGLSTETVEVPSAELVAFLDLTQTYIDHSLRANKRHDDLYHAYNVLHLAEDSASVGNLDIMLEGQVAILSSGLLAPDEVLALLKAMRNSSLYREDQHSYMLYPNRDLPSFIEKNQILAEDIQNSKLIAVMHERSDMRLLTKDRQGGYHFAGDIRNANDVAEILQTLEQEKLYNEYIKEETPAILELFEKVFNHAAFTGRSGTFFAYEGLGSIYWHMVSKLLLAVQENALSAARSGANAETIQELIATYDDVRLGIGFNRSPAVYGAFPTDPYSHSPFEQGAKQPGMTGMVKEEILTRLLELGIEIDNGVITANPTLFRESELLDSPSVLNYVDLNGEEKQLAVPADALAFTFCQVPFVVQRGDNISFTVQYAGGTSQTSADGRLDVETSAQIFSRNGSIQSIMLTLA